MIEKQVFHRLVCLCFVLACAILLPGCQEGRVSIAFFPGRAITVTPTPFRPSSPAPPPAATPTLAPQPTRTAVVCRSERGSIERLEIEYEGRPVYFRLYLPPCFDAAAGLRYPVLYMIHGQTYNDDQWERLGIGEAADRLIHERQVPPFIVVLPFEANTFEDIFISPFPGELVNGILPWVDANYPTCAERSCRAIGGLSRGGAWALRLGFTRWDLFGSIGLHSTPPFIGDPNRLPAWLEDIPSGQVPRVYMDTGSHDWYIASTRQFEELLVNHGVAHEWYLFTGTHDEQYWSSHVADYLVWYAGAWQESEQ